MNLPAILTGIIILTFLVIFLYFRILRRPKKLVRLWEQIQAGETKAPMRRLKAIVIKHGGTVDTHFLLAECYRREGNYQMAVVEYRYCLKMRRKPFLSTEKEIREKLVECYQNLRKDDEALAELLELARLDPKNPKYTYEIAKIFYKKRNLEQAVTYFDKTVKLDPTHAESLSFLGMIMFHANQIKEAIFYLTKAIKYNPKNYMAYYYLGRLYMEGRDFGKALTYFDAAQRSTEYRVRALIQKGNCFRELGEFDNAVDEYKKAIASATGKDQNLLLTARYALASLYESRGKLAEAIDQWENIYRINPAYRDVARKLEQYQDLRADDNMKDFLVSPMTTFDGMCLDIAKHLGYDVLEITHVKSGITNIIGIPTAPGIRNIRQKRVLIKIFRDAIPIGLNVVKSLYEEAKSLKCSKAICISPLNYRSDAIEFASTREIELIDGRKLTQILREIREAT